jgi:putative cobalt transporter subunit CbtA
MNNLWRSTVRASLLGGLSAGGVAALFTLVVMEPTIRLALTVEEARAAAEHDQGGHVHEAELVSRGAQVAGGMLAVLVAALLLSLVYAVALTAFRRSWNLGELPRALVVAAGGFFVFALVPGLKYPGNPPAVGDPATVGTRTFLYAGSLVLAGAVVAALASVVRRAGRRHWSAARLAWAVAGVLVVGGILLFAGLPTSPDPIPGDVGAGLVWRFRVQSLGMLALLWATLGLVTGTLLHQSRAVSVPCRGVRAGATASG